MKVYFAVFSCDDRDGAQGYDRAGIARALADTVGGELIEYDPGVAHLSFPSSAGQLQAAFEIGIEGDTLHLKQFLLYPLDGGQKLAVGPIQLLGFVGQIKGVARNLGFAKLRITAIRQTGATPGNVIDRTFDLTR